MTSTSRSSGLTHVAMSVAEGTLTPAFRAQVIEFYGRHFGWTEIESLRRSDRMTLAVGGRDYVNVRERPDPMVCSGYEHLGLRLDSAASVDQAWSELAAAPEEVNLEELKAREGDHRSFRFRYLLPLTIEVQHLP